MFQWPHVYKPSSMQATSTFEKEWVALKSSLCLDMKFPHYYIFLCQLLLVLKWKQWETKATQPHMVGHKKAE